MARTLIGLVMAGLLLTGCDSGPEVPDGFTEAEAGPVTFAHPEDWREGSPTGGAELQIEGPEGTGGARTGLQVFVADEAGDPAARATALAAELRSSFEEFEVVGQSDTEVDGAQAATLLEYTFTRPEGGTVHSWDVLAEGPGGEHVIFRVEGSEEDLDEDTAQEILDTLSFS
ncbi:MAG: hypothetical protein GEU68_07065 [Actinobacteria bacterium]|nr:hypothetical protein [Actinomycetota bacterium]